MKRILWSFITSKIIKEGIMAINMKAGNPKKNTRVPICSVGFKIEIAVSLK
jgi:hypothetical protein